MAEDTPVVETIGTDSIRKRIEDFKAQYTGMEQQLGQLEQNYQSQRQLAVNTLNQLAGAVMALEQLLSPAEETK